MELGNFANAVDGMQALLQDDSADLRLIKMEVDALMAQGYYKRALDSLNRVSLDTAGLQSPRRIHPLHVAMHIYQCFLETVVKASFKEPLEVTKHILNTMAMDNLDETSIEDAVGMHCPLFTMC